MSLPDRGSLLYVSSLHALAKTAPAHGARHRFRRSQGSVNSPDSFAVTARLLSLAALGWCLSATVVAQEAGVTSQANLDLPLLDSPALTDRTSSEPAAAPSGNLTPEELSAVLQDANAIGVPTEARGGTRAGRRWRVIPYGRIRSLWDDNIFISNTDQQADFSFTITPGIAVGWGDYSNEVRRLGEFERYFEPLSLEDDNTPKSYLFGSYVANASFYAENSGENALDHDAQLVGRWEASKLTLGTRLRFQTLSGTDLDVGDRTKRNVGAGTISSSYLLSEKTSFELNLSGASNVFEDGVDSTEIAAESYINYRLRPKTRLSLGGKFGTVDVKNGARQTYEQALGRISYYASSKLAVSGSGGVEWRQYDSNSPDDLFTVFDVAASYAPFDGTVMAMSAYRRNSASVSLINENVTNTGLAVRFRQRFFQRFFLVLDGGYQKAEYESIQSQIVGGREDDIVYFKPSISFDVTKHLSVETAYQVQRDNSSIESNSFTENLVSLQFNLQF